MDYRAVLLVSGVVGGAAMSLGIGCEAPDPAAITFSVRPSTGAGDPSAPVAATPDGGGGAARTDAAAGDPIFGTEAFVYQSPGQTANNANAAHNGNVQGKDCIVAGCHLDDALDKWLFAGTIYTGANTGITVAQAEIKVVAPDGTEVGHAFTDANGNFWVDKTGPIPPNSRAGVRVQDGGIQHMTDALPTTRTGCSATANQCHGSQTTGKTYGL
jgi:hypothetical protein